ncbi:YqaA family protein [Moraxella osloensis]|nr:YqaA family protein [Moraxella osloensis]MDK1669108.1 YqaA family protein [Moraxella osloensis]
MAYWLLFLAAFGSATLLPMQSEAVLIGLLSRKQYNVYLLLTVASLGNILGSCINFWLGQQIDRFHDKKWFPVSAEHLAKAKRTYDKYGFWSLLLSWVPIIGDPITLFAGVLGERFRRFLLLVVVAKTGRYLMLYAIYQGFF